MNIEELLRKAIAAEAKEASRKNSKDIARGSVGVDLRRRGRRPL